MSNSFLMNKVLKYNFFCIFFLFTTFVQSQNIRPYFNIHAGMNISKNRYSGKTLSSDFVFGPALDVSLELPILKMLSISGGIGFNQKGYAEKNAFFDEKNNGVDLRVISNYIYVPVQMHLYPLKRNTLEFTGGIVQNFLINRKFCYTPYFEAFHGDAKKYDIAVLVGLAYSFHNIRISVDYQHGLCPTFKGIKGFNDRTWHFTLGYKIPVLNND